MPSEELSAFKPACRYKEAKESEPKRCWLLSLLTVEVPKRDGRQIRLPAKQKRKRER